MVRTFTRRAAIGVGAGAAVLPLVSRAQDAPLGYAFRGPAADIGVTLRPTASCGVQTAAQTDGPFYTPQTPGRADLAEPGGPGTPFVLQGLVLTSDCRPVAGAVLDFWHCDEAGVYDNEGFRYRGHQFTDAAGAYRLETIRPGKYPARTEHIHVKMQGPETRRLTTQLYFPDRLEENFLDRIFRNDLLIALQRTVDGWNARFDFVLTPA